MKALVTGGTGFLGRQVVRRLLDRGTAVRCLIRPSSDTTALRAAAGPAAGRLEFVTGNLLRPDSCAAAADGCDVVYHVAAEVTGATAQLFLGNVVATRALIDGCRRAAVGRFVLVSSLGVYGTRHLRKWDRLDETCPLDPEPHRRDPYTFSKVAQEEVAWEAHRAGGLPLAVVRPGVIYGPGRDCVTGRMGIRLGGLLVQMGGRQRLPYTFVENCAEAVCLAGTADAAAGGAFNVVDDDPPTGGELYRAYRAAVGGLRRVRVPGWAIGPLSRACEWYHRWSRGQLPDVLTRYKSAAMWKPLAYSNELAKGRLGWRPEVGFEQGLDRTFRSLAGRRLPN
jgi:nucleoside-diphosphate-sugar epimerase